MFRSRFLVLAVVFLASLPWFGQPGSGGPDAPAVPGIVKPSAGLTAPAPREPAGEREASLPPGTDPGWWAAVQKDIQREEYSVTWSDHTPLADSKGAWQAPNRAQGFRTYFTEKGIRLVPRTEEAPAWEWGLELARWGREGALQDVAPATPRAESNRVTLDRPGIQEWYLNDERGLEQGFAIPAPPASGASPIPNSEFRIPNSPLSLDLALSGTLRPVISEDGQAVDFYGEGNFSVLRHAQLKVTDAAGRILPARFEGWSGPSFPNSEFRIPNSSSGGIRIAIDDTGALYPIHIDPLTYGATWFYEGPTSGWCGYSVATAGDVNGDGYSDVIVGAPLAKKAYLFLGGSSGLSLLPSWTSPAAGNTFGWSVATAGDVNGDGYSDVIVGAPSALGTGQAFLFLGGSSGLAATAAWTGTGEGSGSSRYGCCVATAGDVNVDGYSDVIVGAEQYNGRGKAYLYLGGLSGLPSAASWSDSPCQGWYGNSVATAGDVNGDGYSDVIVGAYMATGTGGKAFLYLGGASGLPATASWTFTSAVSGEHFGISLATAGDVNGDGYSDVVIGANGDNSFTGKGYLFLGSASGLPASASWTAVGETTGDNFGISVATAGDVDGDGYADVIIGADCFSASDNGKAYLFQGGPSGLPAVAGWSREGESLEYFGHSMATAGDVNGDGRSDVIVGAYGWSSESGKVDLYQGEAWGLSSAPSWDETGEAAGDRFGASAAAAGDVNGDGYSDVVVGAPSFLGDMGRAYLFLGSAAGLTSSASWTADGEAAGDFFGASVAAAGDVNGDGYSDVLVGAYGHGSNAGKVYLYMGGYSGPPTTATWTASGEEPGDFFGASAAGAGDVNGDGYADVVVGAYGRWSNNGVVYQYLGGPSGLSLTGWSPRGENDQFFGASVSTAGDVNGDGYSDVVVGAPGDDGPQEGRAYLFLGGPAGLSGDGSSVGSGQPFHTHFGASVATAGDVDGDGYSDVIVGAYGHTSDTGRAYLYKGSSSGLSGTASWDVPGEAAGDRFGASVATAGDVNGDGYSDVAVGAFGHGSNAGKAYLYLGTASGLSTTAAWTGAGGTGGDAYGLPVAGVGDVNGDGFSDLIVGASGDSSSAGKAFLYPGGGGYLPPVTPRQLRSDGSAPIAPLGRSGDGTFRLSLLGRTAFGRGKVVLEWQLVPLGGSFSPAVTPFQSGTVWQDTGLSGVALTEQLTMASGDLPYLWRMRAKSKLATTPFQSHGPWLLLASNGLRETDLRRMPACIPPDQACWLESATRSGGGCRLSWQDPNEAYQRTGWNIRRSGDASLLPKTAWTIIGSNISDSEPGPAGYQWTDNDGSYLAPGEVWYYQVTAFNLNCPAEGPF